MRMMTGVVIAFASWYVPTGVVLQGEVGEGHEATEAQSQPHNPAHREALWREHVHLVADEESEPGDHEVNQGQRSCWGSRSARRSTC